MKKARFLIFVLLLQLCVTLGFGAVITYAKTRDRAPSGLVVWGQNFSGMTRSQLSAQIRERLPETIVFQDQVFPLSLDSTYAEIEHWLDQVFPASKGSFMKNVLQNLTRSFRAAALSDHIKLDQAEIMPQLESISRSIDQPARTATVEFADGQLIRSKSVSGIKFDIDGTWQKLSQEHQQKQVDAVVDIVFPKPSTEDLAQISDNLGDYTTYFNSQDKLRTNNVRLAALALNNQLVPPGEVFSFNNVVGERTIASGYSPAIVFVNQTMIRDIGGGICQDSSTLYQAAMQAHLEIVEKHTHSLPVSYVMRGQDATVAYGILDFRFRNDTKGYLLISVRTGANWLRVRLFGLADDKHPKLAKPEGYPIGPESWDKDPK
ncbi:putative vancomycin resistance protein [Desulfosporosinus orientis DSM 765]|uniref:Putative vancomycin resistance protein n=1 Tax=Desulfosporosinus orientis (strain ATCC 19365 / DSM 765 / NCIMB 8382 / VKM B-1628 / Singapore I) TaxID=768706 RepID=G7WFP4_DESOD|nr:VanW family protein [Desulfosporosinus orientis]AET68917.1 putative vancomycin resistance protein [Desulfosporosinus orientis DSM 765]